MLKKLLTGVLAFALTLGSIAFPETAFSKAVGKSSITASAERLGNYQYEILNNGTVEITDYYGLATNLTIPSTIDGKKVTSIGYEAFLYCTSLTSVTIPNSVTSIGDSAFKGCLSLKSVTIPDSVTSIGACAFYNCSSLKNVTIPDSVTSIGDSAFLCCSSLTSVTIPDSVTSIEKGAFYGCASLTSVTIPDSVTSIGDSAFYECSSLTSVTIPNGVTSIGDSAFEYCSSLESITIPNSVTSIGACAFYKCSSLTSVNIPDSVTSIGYSAFEYCSSLESITIPDSVTDIRWYVLSGCSSLTSVNIPDSVTSIGKYAFYGCSSLKDVYYTGTKDEWDKISIDSYNDRLKNATIHYNYDPNHTHSYTSKITKQPTCTTTGIRTYTCTCGDKYTKSIPATGHKYTETVVKPTYLADGYTLHKCSVCGDIYKDNTKPKLVLSNVSGFKVSATSANAIKLVWGKVSNADGYVVYRYNTSTKKWVRIAKGNNLSFTDKNLNSGTSYKYAIRAYKTVSGKEVLSTSIPTVTTSTNPGKVSGLKVSATTETSIKLSWNKTSGATGYYVYQYKGGKWVKVSTTSSLTYTIKNLSRSTTYKFAVRAYKTLNGTVYNASSYPTITASTLGRYTFKWSKVSGATGYQLQVATYSNFRGAKKYTTTTNSKTVTGLIKGKVYYSRLRAYKTKNGRTIYSSWTYTKKIKV